MNPFTQNEEQVVKVGNFLSQVNMAKNLNMPIARMKPTPSELYINSKIAAGGTASLLTGNVTQQVGITNFDGNKLDDNRYFVADAISIQYGEGNSSDQPYAIDYKKELPAVLKSSHLIIRQKNEIVVKLPICSIDNAKNLGDYYRRLDAFALIEPNSTIEVLIETPSGSTINPSSGDTCFVRVLIRGFETILKR